MTNDFTPINIDLIDQLLKDFKSPEDLLGENRLLKQFTKAVLERAMQAELTHHLGYKMHSPEGKNSGNSRNGKSKKSLKGEFGTLPLEVPRDRKASFEPKIVPKGQTRFDGFDDLILSLYARGMTTRQIQQHLEEIYQVEVLPPLISSVTDAVIDEVRQSLNYVGHKQRKEVARDLRLIYGAATREEAELRHEEFAQKWDSRYPTISPIWRRSWERVVPFLAYPEEIRRVIYTTNAIESVNMGLRKIIKNQGSFPTDEAALKLLYLALQNISQKWTMPIKNWKAALNRFAIVFEGRLPIV